jgi:hypothetical protein
MGLARVDVSQVIVDSVSERLNVDGFRTDPRDLDGDSELGLAWQRARGPFESTMAFGESLEVGDGYVVLGLKDGMPVLSAESADNFTVRYVSGSRTELASALKVWSEETDTGIVTYATLYEPDAVTTWMSDGSLDIPSYSVWKPVDAVDNPLGMVPAVHFRNRPLLSTQNGRSELWGLENDLERVNKLMADLMLMSEFSGFRVRFATGIDVELDENNQPKAPFVIGPDRLLVSPNENTKFGDLAETQIDSQIQAVKMAVTQVAAISRTPMFYLSGDLVNLSGDTLREMRERFRRKVEQRQMQFGLAVEQLGRMVAQVTGTPAETLEPIWRDVDEVDRFEAAQAAATLTGAGVIPTSQAQIDLGYSTLDRERMENDLRAEQARKVAQERLAAQTAPTQQDTNPQPRAAGAEE